MTAFTQDYLNDPRYQKSVRKIANMAPEELAVYQAITAEAPFADEEMRRRLQMQQAGAQKKVQGRRLDLSGQELAQNFANAQADVGLRQRGIGLQREGMGMDQRMFDERLRTQGSRFKDEFDFQKDEDKWSDMIGVGGLVVNTGLGVGELNAKKKLASKYGGLGVWK
jgi:hypothetical protein